MPYRAVPIRIVSIVSVIVLSLLLLNRLTYQNYYDPHQATCQSNLKQLALATYMYAEDWNGYLPPADKWCDALVNHYTSNTEIYTCINTETYSYLGIWLTHKTVRYEWGYAFNSRIGEERLKDIGSPDKQVLIFDSSVGQKNRTDDLTSIPIPGRHYGGSNYAFTDGHVAWRKDSDIPMSENKDDLGVGGEENDK